MNKDTKEKILSLLSKNDTRQAIDLLVDFGHKINNKKIVEACTLFTSRLNQLEGDRNSGAVSSEKIRLAANALTQSIIRYVSGDTWEYIDDLGNDYNYANGNASVKKHAKRNNILLLATIVLSFCLLYFFLIKEKPNPQQTIYVHGYESRTHYVLENNGSLTFNAGHDTRTHIIGQNGRVIFGEVPDNFKGKRIEIGIKSDTFELTHKNKKYIFNGDPIYVEVKMKDEFLTYKGRVKNKHTGIGIPKVKFDVEGIITDLTDKDGRFEFILEEKYFKPSYHFRFEKEGYEIKEDYYYPGLDMLNVPLFPKKN